MGGIKAALALAVGFTMLLGGAASAQSNYPVRPIRIIVPYPAGGIVDIVARTVTEQVGRALHALSTPEELAAYVAAVKAERPEEAEYVLARTLPDLELCRERGFAVSLGEWRREIFGVAAPLYRTPTGDRLSVNCGIPSFRFSAEQIERECGPRMLGLARSIRSLVANS